MDTLLILEAFQSTGGVQLPSTHAQSLSSFQVFATSLHCSPPGSCVHGIFPQEYWGGLPFPLSQAFYAYTKNPAGTIEGLPSLSRRNCIECHKKIQISLLTQKFQEDLLRKQLGK